jgi:hypothetical protein
MERSFSLGKIENTDITFILEYYYFVLVVKFKNLVAKNQPLAGCDYEHCSTACMYLQFYDPETG